MVNKEKAKEINTLLEGANAEDIVSYFLKNFKGKVVFTTSLSIEDQTITKMMLDVDKDANIVTLDTGRLFPETYQLIDKTNKALDFRMDVLFPDSKKVEDMVKEKGINLFYDSVENRKLCCNVRKIQLLLRAIEGQEIWITGLRRSQSVTRTDIQAIEWDDVHNVIKVNPLIEWTEQQTWDYIKENNIPYNDLHDKGYPSIGCEPCTRAIAEDEDIRAGRWWWERPEEKECGLHTKHNTK